VAGDTNNAQDVFVRDLQTGTTILVSVSTDGIPPGKADFYSPIISMDGRYVLFHSKARNLEQNLFLRDLQAGTTYTLTSGTSDKVVAASMTPDGQTIAFIGVIGASTPELYVWNSQAGALVYTNINSFYQNASMVSISANAQKIAAASSSQLYAVDTVSNTTTVIQPSGVFLPSSVGLGFSGDGRFLAYAMSSNAFTNQNVYLYDFQTQSNQLISQNPNTLQPANGGSDSPAISADGRFIAYRSDANDLVAGSTNGLPELIVYDRLANSNSLLSVATTGTASGDSRSMTPEFSGDGRTLVFASWASNLAADDFNHFSDVFAFEFLYLNITVGAPGQGPTISWPYVAGHSYQVESKNNLTDSVWQPVFGYIAINGNQLSLMDSAPVSSQRFYRVVAQ
jgi:Tol biopolymer transport system component